MEIKMGPIMGKAPATVGMLGVKEGDTVKRVIYWHRLKPKRKPPYKSSFQWTYCKNTLPGRQ